MAEREARADVTDEHRRDDWPWVPPPAGPGSGGFGGGPSSCPTCLARRLFEQRVVLLTGALDEVTVTRVSAELMTLDADGDDPVTLRVDCGEADLAPALTLMDVIELMGVPVRALCLGQVGGGAVGVVAVCSHRTALPSTRFSLCEPTTQFEAHVRNVAQWAELRAGERRRFCERVGAAAGQPGGTIEEDLERGRFLSADEAMAYGILDDVSAPTRPSGSPRRRRWREGLRAAADGVSSAALIRGPRRRRRGPRRPHCARGGPGAYDAAMAPPAAADAASRGSTGGPRLPPLAAGEWDGVLTRVLEGSPGGTTEPMHIFTTLGRADPELFRRWLGFGGALLRAPCPAACASS